MLLETIDSRINSVVRLGNRADKATKKPYDPAQFTDKSSSPTAVQLQEKIKLLEMDYKTLHDKRLQDVRANTQIFYQSFYIN